LSKSEYFIYPLVLPARASYSLHKDTFACCVAEALAHGVIVITYPTGALYELYKDCVVFIPLPTNVRLEDMQSHSGYNCPSLYSDEAILNIYNIINELEQNPSRKQMIRDKSIDFARRRYGQINCHMLDNLNLHLLDNIDLRYDAKLQSYLLTLSQKDCLPEKHFNFLKRLKLEYRFNPKTVYDIGSCVLHWTKKAQTVWESSEYILFDAFEPAEFLYDKHRYFIGCLSNTDDKYIKFFQNNYAPGGNSYYKEIGCKNGCFFPDENYIIKKTYTLDSVVKTNQFPLPDLIKIDCQGAEKDILEGALTCLSACKFLIVEMQHTDYNKDAPKVHITKPFIESLGWTCVAERFSENGCVDADYCFVNNKYSF
jgi:FkbM family methyltransferase